MFDIRVVTAKVVLPVDQMAPLRNFLPPSIVIIGKSLDKATEILYNDIPVQEFIVQSPTRIIAKIPIQSVGKEFTNLRVLSTTTLSGKNASLSLKLHNPLQKISGIDRLIQNWLMLFMTTPGSSVFDKSAGGGAQSIIGKPTDNDGKSSVADLTLAVERTKEQIIKKQSSSRNIPADEQLLSADLESVSFDASTGRLNAVVSLLNRVGSSAQVSLE